MVEAEPDLALDEGAAIFPACRDRDEVGRSRKLDVDPERVLEPHNGTEEHLGLRDEPDVHVDRRLPPAVQDGSCAAGEVAGAVPVRGAAEGAYEAPDVLGVG